MLRKDVATACLAPLAIALPRFANGSNIFFAPRNSHVFTLPQGEGINGSRRPLAARIAMTIAHANRRTGHGELDRPTETTSIVAFWTGHSEFLIGFRTRDEWVMVTVHEIFNSVNAMIRKLASSKYRLYSHQKKPTPAAAASRDACTGKRMILFWAACNYQSGLLIVAGREQAANVIMNDLRLIRDYDGTACNHFRCSVQIHINGGSAYP